MKKQIPLTPKEFKIKIKSLVNKDDYEKAHGEMDNILCDLLISLGYQAGIKIFKKQGKWYS
jgi:hypothetical protein